MVPNPNPKQFFFGVDGGSASETVVSDGVGVLGGVSSGLESETVFSGVVGRGSQSETVFFVSVAGFRGFGGVGGLGGNGSVDDIDNRSESVSDRGFQSVSDPKYEFDVSPMKKYYWKITE